MFKGEKKEEKWKVRNTTSRNSRIWLYMYVYVLRLRQAHQLRKLSLLFIMPIPAKRVQLGGKTDAVSPQTRDRPCTNEPRRSS